jgi:hypothetical protein
MNPYRLWRLTEGGADVKGPRNDVEYEGMHWITVGPARPRTRKGFGRRFLAGPNRSGRA